MKTYVQVIISAQTQKEADTLLIYLLKRRLVAGGMITSGLSRYWWKGSLSRTTYFNISSFTRQKLLPRILREVRTRSQEEVPLIWSMPLVANRQFYRWIDESILSSSVDRSKDETL